ncbi:MAG: hypothetical protein ACOC05_07210, partial [Oceanicaulis sp.]
GPALSSYAFSALLSRPEDRLTFDLEVLDRAATALEALLKSGTRCALIAPAGYAALSSSRLRAGYVSALARLSREVRSLLWVRVTGAPSDAPAAVVAETGRTLLSYASQLFFDAELGAATLERAVQSDAPWLGARLPGPLTGAMRQDMERFLAQAERANRAVYLDGVDDWERLRFASRTGARLLTGEGVGCDDAPRAPFRVSRNGLLSRAA